MVWGWCDLEVIRGSTCLQKFALLYHDKHLFYKLQIKLTIQIKANSMILNLNLISVQDQSFYLSLKCQRTCYQSFYLSLKCQLTCYQSVWKTEK